jgi:biotin transport system substrate-specific component
MLGLSAPTRGYLWGFVAAAFLVGWLFERGWDRTLRSSIGGMLLGEVVIFTIGVPWLMVAIDVSLRDALELGLYPFVVGDLLKLMAAALLMPLRWRLLAGRDRMRNEP